MYVPLSIRLGQLLHVYSAPFRKALQKQHVLGSSTRFKFGGSTIMNKAEISTYMSGWLLRSEHVSSFKRPTYIIRKPSSSGKHLVSQV